MMEGKRLLKWEQDYDNNGDPCMSAHTLVGICDVYENNAWCFYDIDDGDADSQDAAFDACESAYIKACTEFLSLYNPATHIVLSREAGETIDNRWSPAMGNRHVDRMASAELHAAMDDK
jgi:hypothetical protein